MAFYYFYALFARTSTLEKFVNYSKKIYIAPPQETIPTLREFHDLIEYFPPTYRAILKLGIHKSLSSDLEASF